MTEKKNLGFSYKIMQGRMAGRLTLGSEEEQRGRDKGPLDAASARSGRLSKAISWNVVAAFVWLSGP